MSLLSHALIFLFAFCNIDLLYVFSCLPPCLLFLFPLALPPPPSCTQDVTKDDGLRYSCTASTSQGEAATGHVALRAIEPPKISPFTFDGDLKEGDRSQVKALS